MVHDGHLFVLQFYASNFGAGWQGEMACFFQWEAFHGLGTRMSQSLILIDALSSACW
jgi:hypothetical protein